MGLYGSPDAGNLYTPRKEKSEKKTKETKEEGNAPQKKLWLWTAIMVFNLLILLLVGVEAANTLTLLALDSMIVFSISAVNLFINLFKQKKIGNDLIFIVFSVITFFIFTMSLAP